LPPVASSAKVRFLMGSSKLRSLVCCGVIMVGCGGKLEDSTDAEAATGGTHAAGGDTSTTPTGGKFSLGGASSLGGVSWMGGTATGGSATGGKATGGSATGGRATGGVSTGGKATGGVSTGGKATGGVSTGGVAGAGTGCTGGLEMLSSSLCVAKLVTVGAAGATFGIDATEVTRGQYATWLATGPAVSVQDPTSCSGNLTFEPNAKCMTSYAEICKGAACHNHPHVCVDWCDAYSYCKAVGKRLCGRRGGATNPFDQYAQAAMSQWYAACSSGGTNTYPYGNTYLPQACNVKDYWNAKGVQYTTTPVASMANCQASGDYAGVYDLSGDVIEWEDSCSADGFVASCRARGGNFNTSSGALSCGDPHQLERGADYFTGVGFRCCTL
jgi:hypothetical protein